ncbi:MAG: 50S ribosomal protein L18 [Calditerrivibrio sp.]|nr:50S ribosomal protein L18 [Calditerrivibrio sp.]
MADKKDSRIRRHKRIRKKVSGTAERPRLAVFRSNRYIYVQVINDDTGNTLVAASSLEKDLREKFAGRVNVEVSKAVGKLIAERALEKGIKSVVFDRGGYIYHGKIKALADSARESGLDF